MVHDSGGMPDIGIVLVRRQPQAITEGRGEQLEAAVAALLKQLEAK